MSNCGGFSRVVLVNYKLRDMKCVSSDFFLFVFFATDEKNQ